MNEAEQKEIVELEADGQIQPIEIKNLLVSPMPLRKLALGEVKDIVALTKLKEKQVESIIWNEQGISLILKEGNTEISLLPEFHPASEMFFQREHKRDNDLSMFGGNKGIRIWEGEFEPIQFSKSNLIKFLKTYAQYFEPEIEQAIKNMRVTEKKVEGSEMLSLDDDKNVRTVTEETQTTNIPRRFKALMPLFGGFQVELDFEASVTNKTNDYGREENKKVIELRCLNARERLRQVMQEILSQFPEEIPKYYGKTEVQTHRDRY